MSVRTAPTVRAGGHTILFKSSARSGSLLGKRRIVMRYRIAAAPGVGFIPHEHPAAIATLALYFQRRGDNWTAKRQFEHYRWYAVHAQRVPLTPGEHEVSLSLDGTNWKSLGSQQAPIYLRISAMPWRMPIRSASSWAGG